MGESRFGSNNGRSARAVAVSLIGVVDDDEPVREALSSLIRSEGYRCMVFPSAEAFLDSGQLHDTDCMVLDVRMPGMSGPDLHGKLHELKIEVPIIYVTANSDDHVRGWALANGAVAYLGKPFDDEVLLGAIRSALNGSK
jgi:FixJ family two-component response regulator